MGLTDIKQISHWNI